uniref:Transmembrane protein n=1 Tax=Mimivirus LCMiAC01 TaxID=2506608 RepID=A0A481Z098_9VIRU|nr:MAG: hypothetical protein LCMiAC01_03580 [Mimivirus LCMiAC01]
MFGVINLVIYGVGFITIAGWIYGFVSDDPKHKKIYEKSKKLKQKLKESKLNKHYHNFLKYLS